MSVVGVGDVDQDLQAGDWWASALDIFLVLIRKPPACAGRPVVLLRARAEGQPVPNGALPP